MSKKKYTIPVNFTTTIDVKIEAEDVEDAMDEAEYEASKIFSKLFTEGTLEPSDFVAEAQEP